jgi:hypothetical protein
MTPLAQLGPVMITIQCGQFWHSSWGTLVNSFEELEEDQVAAFESLNQREAKAWLQFHFHYTKMTSLDCPATST